MDQIVRPFVYGTRSDLLQKNDVASDASHTHKWTVYVQGVDGEDISYFIEKIEFKLHDSFVSPKRSTIILKSTYRTAL